jgi:hypothetical protein
VWWIVAGVVCWSGAVVATGMLQAVTSNDARCLTSVTSLAYGTDVHGLAHYRYNHEDRAAGRRSTLRAASLVPPTERQCLFTG